MGWIAIIDFLFIAKFPNKRISLFSIETMGHG